MFMCVEYLTGADVPRDAPQVEKRGEFVDKLSTKTSWFRPIPAISRGAFDIGNDGILPDIKVIVAKIDAETMHVIQSERLQMCKSRWWPMVAKKLEKWARSTGKFLANYAAPVMHCVLGEQTSSPRFNGNVIKQRLTIAMSLGAVRSVKPPGDPRGRKPGFAEKAKKLDKGACNMLKLFLKGRWNAIYKKRTGVRCKSSSLISPHRSMNDHIFHCSTILRRLNDMETGESSVPDWIRLMNSRIIDKSERVRLREKYAEILK